MPAESVVFIVTFTLAFAAVAAVIFTFVARSRAAERLSEAAEEESHARQNIPEVKRRMARAEIIDAKAEALGAVEADEAAGRTPPMTGDRVAAHRRKVRRQIDAGQP